MASKKHQNMKLDFKCAWTKSVTSRKSSFVDFCGCLSIKTRTDSESWQNSPFIGASHIFLLFIQLKIIVFKHFVNLSGAPCTNSVQWHLILSKWLLILHVFCCCFAAALSLVTVKTNISAPKFKCVKHGKSVGMPYLKSCPSKIYQMNKEKDLGLFWILTENPC